MEFDVITIIAIVASVAIGIAIYYLYQNYDHKMVDKVFNTVKAIFNAYGDRIKQDDPELYEELKDCLDTMEKAMSDDEISIMEAYSIAKSFIPLVTRLEKFIKERYE